MFHSGLWINLHHFLYEQAAITTAGPQGTPHEAELARDAAMTSGLSDDERKTWLAAVAYYRANMLKHDLLSDPMMNRLKDHLEDSGRRQHGLDVGFRPRAHRHAQPGRPDLSRSLVAGTRPCQPLLDRRGRLLVDQHGEVISQEIAQAFEAAWPDSPLRVDVVAYANFAGSYTTLRPSRVTVSSVDGGNQEIAALEVLFHAAAATLIEQVNAAVAHSFGAAGKTAPPELPEAILFYTSGYYVQQLYTDYTPYADRFALWTREDWSGDRPYLTKDAGKSSWQPRLDAPKMTL